MKNCPSCKGRKICRACKGSGLVRIVNGRAKGGGFERRIAAHLTQWTGVKFSRTPSSGGWAKTGDVTPKDPKSMTDFPFNIECKNQEIFSSAILIDAAFKGSIPKWLKSWWKQCKGDAKKSNRVPLLVMTSAHEPIYVMMRKDVLFNMGMSEPTCLIGAGSLRVVLWEDFLNQVTYGKAANAAHHVLKLGFV